VPEPPHSGVIHAAPGRQAAIPPPERGGHQGLGRPGYRLRQQASRWLPARRGGCAPSPPAGGRGGCGRRASRRDGAAVAVGWVGAAQRLAVDGHRPPPWPLRGGGVVVAVACDQPKDRAPADTWSQPGRENTADSASLPIGGGSLGAPRLVARKLPPTRFPSGDLKAVEGHRPRRVAPPCGPFSLAATSPSALRRPPTPGRFRLRPSRAALPRRHRATA